MSEAGFKINVKDYPKLYGQDNYQTWATAGLVAFEVLELLDVVVGVEIKPEIPDIGSSASAETVTAWRKKDTLSRFDLYQAVDTVFYADIAANKTATETGQAFKDRFDKETPATNLMLLEAIWDHKRSSSQNISDHISKFETAWNRLALRCASTTVDDGTTDVFRKDMQSFTTSEAVKGHIFIMSVKAVHSHLCDVLSLQRTTQYADVRNYFTSREAENVGVKEEEKVFAAPKLQGNKGCTWY